jgi:hypothetical protein
LIGWGWRLTGICTVTQRTLIILPPFTSAIQQQHASARDAESASKIIGKFNPLVLGEVHTAGNSEHSFTIP